MSTGSNSSIQRAIAVSLQAQIIPPGYVTAGSLSGGIAKGTFGGPAMAVMGTTTFLANFPLLTDDTSGGDQGDAAAGIMWVGSSAAALPVTGGMFINWGQWYIQIFNNGSTYCVANIPPRGVAYLTGMTSPQAALCANGGPAGSYEASLGYSMLGVMCPLEYFA